MRRLLPLLVLLLPLLALGQSTQFFVLHHPTGTVVDGVTPCSGNTVTMDEVTCDTFHCNGTVFVQLTCGGGGGGGSCTDSGTISTLAMFDSDGTCLTDSRTRQDSTNGQIIDSHFTSSSSKIASWRSDPNSDGTQDEKLYDQVNGHLIIPNSGSIEVNTTFTTSSNYTTSADGSDDNGIFSNMTTAQTTGTAAGTFSIYGLNTITGTILTGDRDFSGVTGSSNLTTKAQGTSNLLGVDGVSTLGNGGGILKATGVRGTVSTNNSWGDLGGGNFTTHLAGVAGICSLGGTPVTQPQYTVGVFGSGPKWCAIGASSTRLGSIFYGGVYSAGDLRIANPELTTGCSPGYTGHRAPRLEFETDGPGATGGTSYMYTSFQGPTDQLDSTGGTQKKFRYVLPSSFGDNMTNYILRLSGTPDESVSGEISSGLEWVSPSGLISSYFTSSFIDLTLSSNVADYEIGSSFNIARITVTGSDRNISGFAARSNGSILEIINVGSTNSIQFIVEDVSGDGTAANRIAGATGISKYRLSPGQGSSLVYSTADSRWHLRWFSSGLSGSGSVGQLATWSTVNNLSYSGGGGLSAIYLSDTDSDGTLDSLVLDSNGNGTFSTMTQNDTTGFEIDGNGDGVVDLTLGSGPGFTTIAPGSDNGADLGDQTHRFFGLFLGSQGITTKDADFIINTNNLGGADTPRLDITTGVDITNVAFKNTTISDDVAGDGLDSLNDFVVAQNGHGDADVYARNFFAAATFTGNLTGNADTASGTAATPDLCPSGQAAGGIATDFGAANCTTYVQPSRTLTGGSGIAAIGDLSADRTISTDSTEAGFLASGALTCGSSTAGKMKVHTTPLQYCDNAATPTLQYAAYGSSTGVATSATALAANGANCSGNNFALGVDASGAAECAQPAFSNLSGSATDAQIPDSITITLAATATALAANGSNCSSGSAPLGVDASGAAEGCFAVTTATSTDTFTNKTLDTSATGVVVTMPFTQRIQPVRCTTDSAAAFLDIDLPTTTPPTAVCTTGTNSHQSFANFTDASTQSVYYRMWLPSDTLISSGFTLKISWMTTATSGNVKWQAATICVANDGTETNDPAFNAVDTVTTAAPAVASKPQTSSITLKTTTCSAGELLNIKILRDPADAADTISATASMLMMELDYTRQM